MADIEMNIVRKQHNFTVIDNGIFKDTSLSAKAKGILTTILSLPLTWKYSIAGLTTLFSDSDTSIRTGLQELEKAGYLKRERVYENGRIVRWKYNIYEIKQQPEEQDVENLDVENQQLEKLQLEANDNKILNKLSTKELDNTTNVVLAETASSCNSTTNTFLGSLNKPTKNQNKDNNFFRKCCNCINEFTEDAELREYLVDYLKVRLESKTPLSFNSWNGIVKKLGRLSHDVDIQIQIVQRSIEKCYDSFYELPNYKSYNNKNNRDKFSEGEGLKSERMTEEDYRKEAEFLEQKRKEGKRTEF
jgi:DNA-binding Lrp family transcriptional regulator